MYKKFISFLFLSAVISFGASAATLKISTQYPDGTAVLKEFRKAAKTIEEETEGRVKVKLYPGSPMSDATAQRKIRINQLSGAIVQTGALASVFKDSQILNAPMLFRSFEEVDYIRDKIDSELVQGFQDAGWITFGLMEGGFAYPLSVSPIDSLDTLKKQKFWIPANDPISEKISQAFGLSPIAMEYAAVKPSLETGAINALAAPPAGALTLQWFTKVKHLTDIPFMYTTATLAIWEKNRDYQKISDSDKAIVNRVFSESIAKLDKQNRKDNLAAYDVLLKQGISKVELSEVQSNEIFIQSELANRKLIEQGEFSADIYQRVTHWLKEFRNQ